MYTKNEWQNGDVITKVKLDNIEDGIYNAMFSVGLTKRSVVMGGQTYNLMVSAADYADIIAAFNAGIPVYFSGEYTDTQDNAYNLGMFISHVNSSGSVYCFDASETYNNKIAEGIVIPSGDYAGKLGFILSVGSPD